MPFAGYTSHQDCRSKNLDKRDPDAYCSTVKRRVEGGRSIKVRRHPRKTRGRTVLVKAHTRRR